MDNLIGKKLDGLYEVKELIGSGGMANVYKAVMLGRNGPVPAGTVVAVKVLRQEYTHDPELVRRFKNESKAISLLNHPNIVKVYDVSVNDQLQYIVMEYVDGMTLREYLNERGGKLSSRETVHFISQILKALEHAHAKTAVIGISGGLDSAMAEIAKLQKSLTGVMNRLKDPTSQVISDLSALCGQIENLSSLLNSAEDLSAAIRHSSADLRDILDDVEDLQDILDDYEPVLRDTLKTVSSLSTSAIKTIRDTQGLISDTEALMKSTGATLDDGTKQTLEGLAAVLRSTAKTMGTAGQIKNAKTSICDIIEDTWDEYTGDVNNLLLMDATADAVSLTDSRNPSPESIQILIRTQEITMPDEDETEAEAAAEVQTTFWGRVAQMFKDFWAAITGLFGGKD